MFSSAFIFFAWNPNPPLVLCLLRPSPSPQNPRSPAQLTPRERERLQATATVATAPRAAVVAVFGDIRTHTGVPGAGCEVEREGLRET